jgi:drug/metabolite transporter (DMT)-like permease
MNLSFVYIAIALAMTVYGHLAIKARVLAHEAAEAGQELTSFLLGIFVDPWVISAFAAAVVAAASWMLALRNADLSFLFPFMALTFVIIPLLAHLIFGERVNTLQVVGFFMIVGGISLATIAR